ncbi:hypothetical protein [Spiroplasma cantharicola]|uniref:ABC-2 type transporter domain-containing protein n=1 Tax=Spiroplasma cantharicola TaxID=362837 RepID=A0A0M4KCC3_9MOLU|nr:hypothetical protein [Spiroplasma cantharicola]ALD66327.1 hypothetical protein SCANT_v1c04210 [Spiroplasma cantharicola]
MRFIKTPINWVFSLIFPIALLLIFGFLLERESIEYGYMAIILIVSLTCTIMPISINLCSDKVEKRIKHYFIINKAMKKYISALYIVNLIIFELVSLIIFLLSFIFFKINVDYKVILMFLTFPLISYTFGFIIAIILGSIINSINGIIPLSMLVFWTIIFISGITLPLQIMWKHYYYLEVLTPFGSLFMLYNKVINSISLSSIQILFAIISLCFWIILSPICIFLALKSIKK